jgi:hypothetical protein
MRRSLVALATLSFLASASAASAQVNENFNNEGNANSMLNWAGNGNITPIGGTIDLVRNGEFGITCFGNTGSCVDLDGSTRDGGGGITSSFMFNAGDLVTLMFDLSGNQRNATTDSFSAGFTFGGLTQIANYTLLGTWGVANIGGFNTTGISTSSAIAGNTGFSSYGLRFRALTAGSLTANVSTSSNDNVGPILDNFSLTIAAVPEPATWGFMILGFGLVGGALRRRRTLAFRPALG